MFRRKESPRSRVIADIGFLLKISVISAISVISGKIPANPEPLATQRII
jgi:hypothetical protein